MQRRGFLATLGGLGVAMLGLVRARPEYPPVVWLCWDKTEHEGEYPPPARLGQVLARYLNPSAEAHEWRRTWNLDSWKYWEYHNGKFLVCVRAPRSTTSIPIPEYEVLDHRPTYAEVAELLAKRSA